MHKMIYKTNCPALQDIFFLFSFIKDMVQKTGDWKKNVEVNSRLMKKFEESRTELEKVLQTAQCCLKEKGNPEELLRKHTVTRISYSVSVIFHIAN